MNVAPSSDIIPASPTTPPMNQPPSALASPSGASADWYANKENLYLALQHYLAMFSEGGLPTVPLVGKRDGSPLNVRATLELPCYAEFPATEKEKWLEGVE